MPEWPGARPRGRAGTFRDREQAIRQDESLADRSERAVRPRVTDDAVTDMAVRFMQKAAENRVSVQARTPRYAAVVLAQTVARSGLMTRPCLGLDGSRIPPAVLGCEVVDYFWEHALDTGDDPLHVFADQDVFDDCLARVMDRWVNRRLRQEGRRTLESKRREWAAERARPSPRKLGLEKRRQEREDALAEARRRAAERG